MMENGREMVQMDPTHTPTAGLLSISDVGSNDENVDDHDGSERRM